MKKLIALALLTFTTTSFANELHNFNDVKTAALNGKSLHIAIDFSNCSSTTKEISQMQVGVFTPNAIAVMNDHIATSLTHFTLNNPYFSGKPVYEFARYTMTENNNINVSIQILDAINYTVMTKKFIFNCKIDSGAKVYD